MTPTGGSPPPTALPVFTSYRANLFFGALHCGQTYASGCMKQEERINKFLQGIAGDEEMCLVGQNLFFPEIYFLLCFLRNVILNTKLRSDPQPFYRFSPHKIWCCKKNISLYKGDKRAWSSKGFCKVYMNPQSMHMWVALACKKLDTISVKQHESKK